MTSPIALSGAPGSPYTRKMLAVLRYRRIPYRFLISGTEPPELPRPMVQLLPTFYLPGADGALEAVVDSTPIIARLEAEHVGRSLRPADPALAFLDALIEDYGDEWLTKPMFHYRWAYEADIARAAAILPAWRRSQIPDEALLAAGRQFAERQIGRLRVVGSNPTTGPIIEASYRRFLEAFEDHLRHHRFVLGGRPAAADFALYGQLTQLSHFDPTPMELTLKIAPRVFAWVDLMEDLSGLEPQDGDWFDSGAPPPTLIALLAEIGRVYPPVMLANAQAVAQGADGVVCEVDGARWEQAPFPYQAKCLKALREAHTALPGQARARIDAILGGTGLAALFA
ncbi:MAG: glutathione S-transferase N-terminal domain-containing protein [Phenylobacterium sp.]|uniref:glutathione S-transferase N-terminal domain-containing protein n=1 Tax=Phenylobacterium sp. TaxID=1871053 RepID=UPI00391DF3AB